MKTGVFTASMPEYTPAEAVAILKELGYDGVEWRVAPVPKEIPENVPFEVRYWQGNKCTIDLEKVEEEAAYIRDLCKEAQISIIGLTSYLRPHEYEQIERVLKAAVTMECRQVRVFPPDYKETEHYETLFARTREDVKVLEQLAKKYELKIVFEIHMDNLLATASAARRLLDGMDANYLGVIFDPGNMVFEGFENYKKSFEMLGDYLAYIHIKNGMMECCGEDEHGVAQWKRSWVPLRKGTADLKKLFAVMKETGYKGNISVEDFSNEETTYEKLRQNLEYIRELSAER